MSYEVFQKRINALLRRVKGGGITVQFSHSDGKHFARFSDGTTIIGNAVTPKVMVNWGSGHAARATI